jgi:hypothetical protein
VRLVATSFFDRGKAGIPEKTAAPGDCVGIDEMGCKTILGFHQGASKDQTACDGLFSALAARGLNVRQLHLQYH